MTNCKAEKEGNKNMSKVKDENYIHIPGWAVTRLGLKGNELLVYSIIYGFSQDGETRFTGGLQYLADWTNSTKQSCIKCLKSLVEKGYNPINQIVGYILSGDPTYITSHNDARNKIRTIERDELLEKMVKNYIGIEVPTTP